MNRRTLLWSLAFAAGGGALWRYRDWLPVRGLFNPCHAPRLPDEIAAHPAMLRVTQDLDLSKVWDCHVHLVGTGDSEPGEVWVNPNRYAQAVAASHPQWEWICSVHPYRDDAVDALQWAAEHGARAVKWLPPAMGMDPSSPRCDPFYAAMERLNLPLLTHGGHELAAQGGGHQGYGDPLLLRRGLDHGVRVIVAHCASLGTAIDSLRPGEPETATSNFHAFMEMMRDPDYGNLLYGDLSAITQVNRAPEAVKALLLADDIHHRLLNGSDYPLTGILPLFSRSQLVRLGLIDEQTASVVFEVQKYNPLLFDLALKRNLEWQGRRFPRQVFETAEFFQHASGSGEDLTRTQDDIFA